MAAVFGPFMSLLDITFGDRINAENGKVIYNEMMTDKFQITGLAMFPMFIVLICPIAISDRV
jgi:hypothetical protein